MLVRGDVGEQAQGGPALEAVSEVASRRRRQPLKRDCQRWLAILVVETNLNKAELHFAGFADHMLVPGRVPDQLNISFVNAGNGKDL